MDSDPEQEDNLELAEDDEGEDDDDRDEMSDLLNEGTAIEKVYTDDGDDAGETMEAVLDTEPLTEEVVAEVSDERNLGLKFPLTRVKRIMKADPDLQLASQDAVFLIAKATELFVEVVADAAFHHTLQAGRKTLSMRDVDACIGQVDALLFLDGTLHAD